MGKRKMFLRMITSSLIRRKSRMIVALLSIAIGATILSGLVTIYHDIPRQMGAQFRNYGANMIFTPSGDDLSEDEVKEGLALIRPEELVGAAMSRYETVRIHEQPVMIVGTDMEQVQKTSPYWSVDGAWPSAPGEIMIGKNIAESLSLKDGETIEVSYAPEAEQKNGENADTRMDNSMNFTIVSILSTGGSEEKYVYVSMEDLRTLTGSDGSIDVCELSVSAASDALSSYCESISAAVPGISAKLVKRVTASEATVLSKLQGLILLVTIVVLALTMISVATTMTAVVAERRKEIGLKKAIGASDAGIMAEFMGEGLLLGMAGGLLGAFLGFAFAQYVSVHVFASSIAFRPLLIPVTIIVSDAVTAAACVLPVRSATMIDPALVLKGE